VLQRMVYSKFSLRMPDPRVLEEASLEPYPFCPESKFRLATLIDEPAAQIVFEDWYKDNDVEWVYWLDAIHIVVSGRAEITYWNPPDWTERGTALAEPGAIYLTPRGAHVKWRILSDEPFRHIVIDIPNGGYTDTTQGR